LNKALKLINYWDNRLRILTLGDIAEELARIGKFDSALSIAEMIEDDIPRSITLRKIVMRLTMADLDKKDKVKLLDKALSIAEGINNAPLSRSETLIDIGIGLTEIDKNKAIFVFEKALSSTKMVNDFFKQSEILSRVAIELAKIDKNKAKSVLEKALNVANYAYLRTYAFERIAVGFAMIGEFEKALKIAENIDQAESRSLVLKDIALELTEAGLFDKALSVAKKISDADRRSSTLAHIAVKLAKVDLDKALRIAEDLERSLRLSVFRRIVEVLAEAGMFDEALSVTEMIFDTKVRSSTLKSIAKELAKADLNKTEKLRLFDIALNISGKIHDTDDRLVALSSIAVELTKANLDQLSIEFVLTK